MSCVVAVQSVALYMAALVNLYSVFYAWMFGTTSSDVCWVMGRVWTLVVSLAKNQAYFRTIFLPKPTILGTNVAIRKKKKKTTLFSSIFFLFNFELFGNRDSPPAWLSVFLSTECIVRIKLSCSALFFHHLSQWLVHNRFAKNAC